jgi:cystathionine beta-synthase
LREISTDRAGGRVQIVGVDPVGSVYSGGSGQPYLVEGVGEDFWPEAYDPSVVDRIVAVSDQQSFDMTLRLAREEGLLVGGSCGMAAVGALEVARELGPDDIVVVLLPDGGRGYLGKIFNEGWMLRHGFTRPAGSPTVADLLGTPPRPLPHLRRESSVADAVAALESGDVALPVLAAEPPVVLGEVLGAVDASTLLRALATGDVTAADPITHAMGPSLPVVGAHESLESARDRFGERGAGGRHPDALLVLDGGNPIGLLTRTDLIAALAATPGGTA